MAKKSFIDKILKWFFTDDKNWYRSKRKRR